MSQVLLAVVSEEGRPQDGETALLHEVVVGMADLAVLAATRLIGSVAALPVVGVVPRRLLVTAESAGLHLVRPVLPGGRGHLARDPLRPHAVDGMFVPLPCFRHSLTTIYASAQGAEAGRGHLTCGMAGGRAVMP